MNVRPRDKTVLVTGAGRGGASAVLWLTSPVASFTTGEVLTVDGGYAAR